MTWTKLSDGFNDDPDLLGLPRGIRLMHVEALVWSNGHGTDGRLPRHVLARITDEPDPVAAAEQLVASGLWSEIDAGWSIAFGDQMKADEVQKRREATALRTRRWDHHRNDIHDLCLPRYCKQADTSGSVRLTPSGDALPPDPPARPARGGRERERSGSEAGGAIAAVGGDQSPAEAAPPARWGPPINDIPDGLLDDWMNRGYDWCGRCQGAFTTTIVLEDQRDDIWLCPECTATKRRRSNRCLAFTKAGKECGNDRQVDSLWCKYHLTEDRRGQAGSNERGPIDRAADKTIAGLASAGQLSVVAS